MLRIILFFVIFICNIAASPYQTIIKNNKSSIRQPDKSINSITVYKYEQGALYQVYCSPLRITDIILNTGENLTFEPAAGDTKNWIVGITTAGGVKHILVKPVIENIKTNMIISTNERIYYLELHSSNSFYQPGLKWEYKTNKIIEKNIIPIVKTNLLDDIKVHDFNYKIVGLYDWRPVKVFNDNQKTYIQFSKSIHKSELPVFYIGENNQIVNYRVYKDYIIIDRLFKFGSLVLGNEEVRIFKADKKEDYGHLEYEQASFRQMITLSVLPVFVTVLSIAVFLW